MLPSAAATANCLHTVLQEIEDLCTEWQPEPLFKAATKNQPGL